MAYISRNDIESVFGRANVAKWADLDNNGDAEAINARIVRAIEWASAELDSRMRKSPYALPIRTSDDKTPTEIIDVVANLAGVWLYENRGVVDYTPDTGTPVHRLMWARQRAETTIREILAGVRTLDAVRKHIDWNIPTAVNAPSSDNKCQ